VWLAPGGARRRFPVLRTASNETSVKKHWRIGRFLMNVMITSGGWKLNPMSKSQRVSICLRSVFRINTGCVLDGNWQDTWQEGEVYFTGMDGEISFRLSTQRKGFSGRIRLVQQIRD
jgi:hypothetical protein